LQSPEARCQTPPPLTLHRKRVAPLRPADSKRASVASSPVWLRCTAEALRLLLGPARLVSQGRMGQPLPLVHISRRGRGPEPPGVRVPVLCATVAQIQKRSARLTRLNVNGLVGHGACEQRRLRSL